MTDTCELIRARSFAVLGALEGLGTWAGPSGPEPACWRNRTDLDLPMTPAVLFLDGSDSSVVDAYGHAKPGIPHNLMRLRPQIIFVSPRGKNPGNLNIGGTGLAMGPYLASWRVNIVKALARDDTLLHLLGDDGQIEYLGHETDFVLGASMNGGMLVDVAMTYVFDTEDL